MPSCFKCNRKIDTISGLNVHFKTCHVADVFDSYECKEVGCFSTFQNWAQFRRHFNRLHSVSTLFRADKATLEPCDSPLENFSPVDDAEGSSENDAPRTQKAATDLKDDLHLFLFEFVGSLYADPKLPRSHVQVIVDATESFVNRITSVLFSSVASALTAVSADEQCVSKVQNMFEVVQASFSDFHTEYRRLKLLSDSGCLLKPEPFHIGFGMKEHKKDNHLINEIVSMTGQFVPLRRLFKKFFSLPGVYEKCYNYMLELESQTDIVSNFVQAKSWKKKKQMHFPNKIVFPLFIFFDDLEVNNALGSHKGVSKIGATYVTIPCLPPEYRSSLDNIFLALLCYSLDRSAYGNEAVFQILVDEINFLQRTGITLNISGSPIQVYFALGLILGDNLGLNGILGYVESFRANYFCRFCKTHRDQTHVDKVERPETLRKVEDYLTDVKLPTEDSGVKEMSVWNNVDFFHVYENFCSDPLLHELAEGVGKRAMRRTVNYFVNVSNAFSLHTLNERLKTFPYTAAGFSNKPPLISAAELAKKKIYMSGSEMLTFISVFGLLVGDLVKPDDKVWGLYLILRQILEIVNARAFQPGTENLLKYLISVYNTDYQELFQENLKAKEHIMTHWPMIMSMSGPLSLISSMRMEAKHRLFKVRANATSSRVDIIYTTALKEQLQFSFRVASQRGLVSKFEMGPATPIQEDFDYSILPSSDALSIECLERCVDVPWVDVKGTYYKVGMCLALKYDEFDNTVFGDIHKILCTESNGVIFICNVLLNEEFDEHFHAYVVSETTSFLSIKHDELLTHLPAVHHEHVNRKRYVFMR